MICTHNIDINGRKYKAGATFSNKTAQHCGVGWLPMLQLMPATKGCGTGDRYVLARDKQDALVWVKWGGISTDDMEHVIPYDEAETASSHARERLLMALAPSKWNLPLVDYIEEPKRLRPVDRRVFFAYPGTYGVLAVCNGVTLALTLDGGGSTFDGKWMPLEEAVKDGHKRVRWANCLRAEGALTLADKHPLVWYEGEAQPEGGTV